jgi:hypothetical protein
MKQRSVCVKREREGGNRGDIGGREVERRYNEEIKGSIWI